jgi:hypothetical protein
MMISCARSTSAQRRLVLVLATCTSIILLFHIAQHLKIDTTLLKTAASSLKYPHLFHHTDAEDASPAAEDVDDDGYIAICVPIRDQALDLAEFLSHHYHHHQISRIHILDDRSLPPLSTYTFPVPESAITYTYFEEADHVQWMQYKMYNECHRLFGARYKWLAFMDVDEFLEVRGGESLRDILAELDTRDDVGALGINWKIHTSSGVLKRPQSARQAFDRCIVDRDGDAKGPFRDNMLVKSIVKSSAYASPMSPYVFQLKDGKATVGEKGDALKTDGTRVPITHDRIVVHHYAVKSREEFEERIVRGTPMGQAKDWDYWAHLEASEQVDCNELVDYTP